jgi:hypothetical protein
MKAHRSLNESSVSHIIATPLSFHSTALTRPLHHPATIALLGDADKVRLSGIIAAPGLALHDGITALFIALITQYFEGRRRRLKADLTYHGLAVPIGDDAGMALRLGATVVGEDGGGHGGENEECETHVDVCEAVGLWIV